MVKSQTVWNNRSIDFHCCYWTSYSCGEVYLSRHSLLLNQCLTRVFISLSIITLVLVYSVVKRHPNSGPIPDHFWHFGSDPDQVRNSGPFWSLWQIIKGVIACDDSPAAMFQIDSMTSKTFKLGPKCKIMQIKTHRSFLHYASLSNLEVAWIGPALHLACFWDQGLHLWSRLPPPEVSE